MRAALIQQWLTKRHFMRPPLQEVVLKAEEGLLEGLEMLKHSLEADHLIVGAALREHGRYVHVWVGAGGWGDGGGWVGLVLGGMTASLWGRPFASMAGTCTCGWGGWWVVGDRGWGCVGVAWMCWVGVTWQGACGFGGCCRGWGSCRRRQACMSGRA